MRAKSDYGFLLFFSNTLSCSNRKNRNFLGSVVRLLQQEAGLKTDYYLLFISTIFCLVYSLFKELEGGSTSSGPLWLLLLFSQDYDWSYFWLDFGIFCN